MESSRGTIAEYRDRERSLKPCRQIGQMVVIGFDGLVVSDAIKTMIEKYHVGSVFLTRKNFMGKFACSVLVNEPF
jgi:hypothetical protein